MFSPILAIESEIASPTVIDADLRRLDRLDVAAGVDRDLGDHLHEALELIVTRDEVGFGIDLDNDALGARHDRADEAVRRDAIGFLRRLGDALLAQPVDRAFHVAAGRFKRRLAVHHARAGRLAEILDHCR